MITIDKVFGYFRGGSNTMSLLEARGISFRTFANAAEVSRFLEGVFALLHGGQHFLFREMRHATLFDSPSRDAPLETCPERGSLFVGNRRCIAQVRMMDQAVLGT